MGKVVPPHCLQCRGNGVEETILIPCALPATAGARQTVGWLLAKKRRTVELATLCRVHGRWEPLPRLELYHAHMGSWIVAGYPNGHGLACLAHLSALARAGTPARHAFLLSRGLQLVSAYTRHTRRASWHRDWTRTTTGLLRSLHKSVRFTLGSTLPEAVATLQAISGLPDPGLQCPEGIARYGRPTPHGWIEPSQKLPEDPTELFCDFRIVTYLLTASASSTCWEADLSLPRGLAVFNEHLRSLDVLANPSIVGSMAQILIARYARDMVRLPIRDRFSVVLEPGGAGD